MRLQEKLEKIVREYFERREGKFRGHRFINIDKSSLLPWSSNTEYKGCYNVAIYISDGKADLMSTLKYLSREENEKRNR